VPVLTGSGTWERLAPDMGDATHRTVGLRATVELGPFRVQACPTSHDAADPVAIVVRTADGTGVGVAYDLGRPTTAVRYLLRNLTALVLEANHDEVRLRTSGYPPVVQRRIAGSGGHLSNRAAAELLMELHHPGLAVVVLAHLSRRCNTAADARATVAPALRRVGFGGSLHVAAQDEPLAVIEVAEVGRTQLRLAL
jgi:phosphoribosyl 1,2-cyclic phosphodiesterase